MRRKARRSDAPGLSAFVDFMSLISAGGLLSVGGDLSPSFRMRNSARMSGEDSSPRILELGSLKTRARAIPTLRASHP
ncbi:hypothetical protein D3C81_1128610 [compost metagenome]